MNMFILISLRCTFLLLASLCVYVGLSVVWFNARAERSLWNKQNNVSYRARYTGKITLDADDIAGMVRRNYAEDDQYYPDDVLRRRPQKENITRLKTFPYREEYTELPVENLLKMVCIKTVRYLKLYKRE